MKIINKAFVVRTVDPFQSRGTSFAEIAAKLKSKFNLMKNKKSNDKNSHQQRLLT